ncbi:GM15460 [Drosophila sechellia]|uniref:GM15460 n=1 Tax=Drosophila sechellia TaxID=7238 RepID=B4IL72_DROSE|nr:GM15460 [Drosophila sechellia]
MGGKEAKASDNTANVINTVDVIDHKDEILVMQHTLNFIAVGGCWWFWQF